MNKTLDSLLTWSAHLRYTIQTANVDPGTVEVVVRCKDERDRDRVAGMLEAQLRGDRFITSPVGKAFPAQMHGIKFDVEAKEVAIPPLHVALVPGNVKGKRNIRAWVGKTEIPYIVEGRIDRDALTVTTRFTWHTPAHLYTEEFVNQALEAQGPQ